MSRFSLHTLALGLLVAGSAFAGPSASPALPNDLDRAIERIDAEQSAITAELGAIEPRRSLIDQRIYARTRAYYRLLHAGLLPAGGGFDAMVDYAARVSRVRQALGRDLDERASLGSRQSALSGRLAELRIARAPLDVQREAMDRARFALQEADERRAAFERAFGSSTRADHIAIYGSGLGPTDVDQAKGFAALRGHLPICMTGRTEVKHVHLASAGGPGVELTGAASAAVRSVASGHIAFADAYDDYGMTIIIDHGDRYFSVYGRLGSIDVKVGDSVSAGGRIGAPSKTAKGQGLVYFELRRGAETIDPRPWLGL